ncbi:hypothetical protein [Micavibrio aeruginosavorus]|uniref:hypothetical protein n=1 Tax=Micavibrio aeruginosavorus TaxID=349221 RepID=UPI001F3026F2|nr:hypothetical protein [Micavibrio aeruginosavorus]
MPAPAEETLSDAFSKAVFGRKFRTCEYTNVHLPEGNSQYLKAVALAADQWNVVKVSQVGDDYTIVPVLENVQFGKAAQYLLEYEATALDMNLIPCGMDRDALGFDHVENFCLREGIVPDRHGRLHLPVEGEIVTSGNFDPNNIKKYENLYAQIQSRDLVLTNVWNSQCIVDLFAHYKEGPQWSVLRQDIAEMHCLKEIYFAVRCAVLIEQCVLDIQNGSKKYNDDPINKITGLFVLDGFWINDEDIRSMAMAAVEDRNFAIADHIIERSINIIGTPVVELADVKEDAIRFLRDLRIFECVRKSKDLLSNGALSMGAYQKQKIDEWMCTMVTMAGNNGYSDERTSHIRAAMCDTTPLTELPVGAMDFMAKLEASYREAAMVIDRKIGNDHQKVSAHKWLPQSSIVYVTRKGGDGEWEP